jgi:hypothetical protein
MFYVRPIKGSWTGLFLVALLAGSLRAGAAQPQPKSNPQGSPDKAAEIKTLLKERHDKLQQGMNLLVAYYKEGKGIGEAEGIFRAQRDLLKVILELHESAEERVAALEKHLMFATSFQELTKARAMAMTVRQADVVQAEASVLEARIELLRAQSKINPAVGGEELASVKGTITFDGRPLTTGKIILHLSDGQFVGAKIKDDGTFKIDRVLPGKCKVTIEATAKTPKGEVMHLLPPKYSLEEQSGLLVEVKSGANTHNFDLSK